MGLLGIAGTKASNLAHTVEDVIKKGGVEKGSFSRIFVRHKILLRKGGLYEKLEGFFYDGNCIYGFTLSHAGIWPGKVRFEV